MTWQTKKLGDLAMIVDGTHQTPKYISEGIPFYSVENVTANNFSETKFVSDKVYMKESEDRKIRKNDILMTRIGDIGTAKLIDWDVKASFYVSLALIRCDYKQIAPRYLVQVINSSIFKKELLKKSLLVAFPNKINLGDINKCTLRLPKLAEQERIVGVLEVWDEYLEKLERKIELTTTKLNALLSMIFCKNVMSLEFEKIQLTELCNKIKSGGTPTATNKSYYHNGSIPFLSIGDMTSQGKYLASTEKFINELGLNNSSAWLVPVDSIVYSMYASVGEVAINKVKLSTSQAVISIVPNEKVLTEYLYYFLKYYKKIISKYIETGTQGNINAQTVKKIEIPLVPTGQQMAIVNILSGCDREIELLKSKKSQIEQQKKFLLKKLVSGELRTPEDILEKGVSR